MSEFSTEQVRHLAGLARIALTEDELGRLAGELGAIVDNVAIVQQAAGAEIEATSHPIPLVNVFRDDVPTATLTAEQAVSGAPEHDGSRFTVSAILGEEQ